MIESDSETFQHWQLINEFVFVWHLIDWDLIVLINTSSWSGSDLILWKLFSSWYLWNHRTSYEEQRWKKTFIKLQFSLLKFTGQVRRNTYDVCPYQRPNTYCTQGLFFPSIDESDCYDDTECSSRMKCCMQGCSKKCVEPVHYSTCKSLRLPCIAL